jgi:quinoprotein glucose dehydrogenase
MPSLCEYRTISFRLEPPVRRERRHLVETEIATKSGRASRLIVGAILVVIGAVLSVGGGALIFNGGSPYYIITGFAVIASGILIGRGDWRGVAIYGAMLVWTVAWALWEVGWNGWQLAPRLVAPFVLGLLLCPPSTPRRERFAGDRTPLQERPSRASPAAASLTTVCRVRVACAPNASSSPTRRLTCSRSTAGPASHARASVMAAASTSRRG